MVCRYYCFIGLLLSVVNHRLQVTGFIDPVPVAEKWKRIGFEVFDEDMSAEIIGMVRFAIMHESREVYMNLDHSYLDAVFDANQAVNVMHVPRNELGSFIFEPITTRNNSLDIVVSLPSNSSDTSPNEIDSIVVVAVDEFLRYNPCFIPLKDPGIILRSGGDPKIQKRISSRQRRKILEINTFHQLYPRIAVMFRLHSEIYGATCRLMTSLARSQNPIECPTNKMESYSRKKLDSHGFYSILKYQKLDFYKALKKKQLFLPMTNNSWAWTNFNECPMDLFKNNPWSCHFIAFSQCLTPTSIIHTKGINGPDDWEQYKPCKTCEVSTAVGAESWLDNRVNMYMTRANIQLRERLRNSLRSLMRMNNNYDESSNSIRIHASEGIDQYLDHSSYHLHPPPLLHRCIGIHVRNGDIVTDDRDKLKIDRSLAAHIACMKNMSSVITGVSSIFLATDNSTLFHMANKWYPEYTWYYQNRTLPIWTRKTIGFGVHRFENSVQQDLANIFADGIMMSRCSLLHIGTSSSAVSRNFHKIVTIASIHGRLPVNTIDYCQKK